MRIFIGYTLTTESREQVEKWQKGCGLLPEAKRVLPKNFHLTLLYNGELTTEQVQCYLQQLRKEKWPQCKQFSVKGITTFEKKKQAIIVANIENVAEIQAVHERLQKLSQGLQIPYTNEPNWQPHITLARQKNIIIEKEFRKNVKLTSGGLMIFTSKQSFTGITYEVIAEL